MIKQYASVSEMRSDYIRLCVDSGRNRRSSDGRLFWYGNETAAQTLRLSAEGDSRLVPQAEALLEQLDTTIETPRKAWELAPAGAFANIPAVLAGRPCAMHRLTHQPDERAPITILATTTSSEGIDAASLARRGTVILSLVMALARTRPVSLHQLTCVDGTGGETVLTAQINTTPLDLATACYVLTSSGFSRRLTLDLAEELNNFSGGWPRGFNSLRPEPYFNKLVLRLGLDPAHTLVIPAAHLSDQLLKDPIAWVNAKIKYFTCAACGAGGEADD